ncbi:MAG: triple tyrosine motif-containing protein [Bacteroidetes bacterium]|nr:triple tyrosine motif-containing protein [Bacteroidota bacterium]
MRCYLILLSFLLFQLNNSAAIFPFWKVRNYSVNEGLTQNSVQCFFQDTKGYIWIGTGDGLNLLNGNDIIPFRAQTTDSCSYTHKAVRGIVEDTKGNLYFGSEDGLIIYRNRSCFMNVAALKNESVIPVTITGKGVFLWIQCKGLYLFDPGSNRLTMVDPVFSAFCHEKGIGLTWIHRLGRTDDWLINTSEGCYMMTTKGSTGNVNIEKADQLNQSAVHRDQFGSIWVIKKEGLFLLGNDKKLKKIARLPSLMVHYRVNGFSEPDPATLLVGTYGSGLWLIDKQTGKAVKVIREGLNFSNKPAELITCLFTDLNNNIWIGTDGNGAEIFRKEENLFPHIHSLPWTDIDLGSGFCKTFTYLNSHQILICCYNSLPQVLNLDDYSIKTVQVPAFFQQKSSRIIGVICRDQKILLAGDDGLWQASFSEKNGFIRFNDIRELTRQRTHQFFKIEQNIWICNAERKLHEISYSAGQFRISHTVSTWDGIAVSPVAGSGGKEVFISRNNYILRTHWPVTGNIDTMPVITLPSEVSKVFFIRNTLPLGTLVGTNSGLFIYNKEYRLMKHYSMVNGLNNNYIYTAIPDQQGRLWCSSNGGISCIEMKINKIRNFGVSQGIQSPEFNSGAYLEGSDGSLILGGIQGFNIFYPSVIIFPEIPARTVITSLSVNENPLPGDAHGMTVGGVFSSKMNNWWFQVVRLDYSLPQSNKYAFLLEGYDEKWISAGTLNNIRYQRLPPGKYRLLVKITTADNQYGPDVIYVFTISYPYYQTWWFILLVIALIFFILRFIIRIYLRNKYLHRIHSLEKERAIQAERLRISKDMHDDIGTGISQIAILSEIAKKTASQPETNRSVLDKISKVAGELIDNISTMIWITKTEYDNLESLLYYLREYAGSLFENTIIMVDFQVPEEIPKQPLHNQVRRNIFLIYKEILNNILKHSHAKNVYILMEFSQGQLHLHITDNGVGFDITREKLFHEGLKNMNKRAAESNGSLMIKSSPGEGTTVELSCTINSHKNVNQKG